jgi:hypothetical protein
MRGGGGGGRKGYTQTKRKQILFLLLRQLKHIPLDLRLAPLLSSLIQRSSLFLLPHLDGRREPMDVKEGPQGMPEKEMDGLPPEIITRAYF